MSQPYFPRVFRMGTLMGTSSNGKAGVWALVKVGQHLHQFLKITVAEHLPTYLEQLCKLPLVGGKVAGTHGRAFYISPFSVGNAGGSEGVANTEVDLTSPEDGLWIISPLASIPAASKQ